MVNWFIVFLTLEQEDADNLSKMVNEALELLEDYNHRLSTELDDRGNLAKMLKNFTIHQDQELKKAEEKLKVSLIYLVVSGLEFHNY